MTFDQADYDVRCEWGLRGLQALAPISDVVVIIDILSFSTAVDIAVARGARILPYRWRDDSAAEYAAGRGALPASPRAVPGGYSLAPGSLQTISPGTSLVLPSPNGSTLSLSAGKAVTLTACLRNCAAVAAYASGKGSRFAVIPAGEQWSDGALRPCLEDIIGAGALLRALPGSRSPEAELAIAVFERFRSDLYGALARSGSGRELAEAGFMGDIELAAEYDSSPAAPLLAGDEYINAASL